MSRELEHKFGNLYYLLGHIIDRDIASLIQATINAFRVIATDLDVDYENALAPHAIKIIDHLFAELILYDVAISQTMLTLIQTLASMGISTVDDVHALCCRIAIALNNPRTIVGPIANAADHALQHSSGCLRRKLTALIESIYGVDETRLTRQLLGVFSAAWDCGLSYALQPFIEQDLNSILYIDETLFPEGYVNSTARSIDVARLGRTLALMHIVPYAMRLLNITNLQQSVVRFFGMGQKNILGSLSPKDNRENLLPTILIVALKFTSDYAFKITQVLDRIKLCLPQECDLNRCTISFRSILRLEPQILSNIDWRLFTKNAGEFDEPMLPIAESKTSATRARRSACRP